MTGATQEDYAAVEEINVILNELHWQLLQVRKSLTMLKDVESMQGPQTQQALIYALEQQEGRDEVFKQ